jgi:cyclopropane fatty-acyl-phospholipid synthase-like methyltransferase
VHQYGGLPAVDECASAIGMTKQSNNSSGSSGSGSDASKFAVVDVGSALGGSARYLAGKYGCEVMAIELQDDLHATAAEITARCGMASQVHHVCGDILTLSRHIKGNSYDAVVSWLTFLHISDKATLFKNCFDLLKPNGMLFTEDFFQRQPLTSEEIETMKNDFFCTHLPSIYHYKADLLHAGFDNVTIVDMTEKFSAFTHHRAVVFKENREEFLKWHPLSVYESMLYHYELIDKLFKNGNLGGLRITARKPTFIPRPPHLYFDS